jgi:hypothetical protein
MFHAKMRSGEFERRVTATDSTVEIVTPRIEPVKPPKNVIQLTPMDQDTVPTQIHVMRAFAKAERAHCSDTLTLA